MREENTIHDSELITLGENLELETVFLQNVRESGDIGAFKNVAKQFEDLMMTYSCAIREVRTKLEVLNEEFKVRREHNPIEIIKYRVKKPASIYEKLLRRGYPVSLESIEKNLHDVAGSRVICSYVQDIYMVADLLTAQNDITLLEVKDYIKNPKPNGYRSLHLVVEIPVFFSEECRNMKVEVQIRTIAMDFWATLEHQLKYKNDGDVPEGPVEELRACSDVIADSDMRMQNLYNQVYKQG